MEFDQIEGERSFSAVQVQGMQARYSRSETPLVGWSSGETSMYSDCIPNAFDLTGWFPFSFFVQI